MVLLTTKYFLLLLLLSSLYVCMGGDAEEYKALPDCSSKESTLDSFVFVSTIDGKLTALNGLDGGSEIWNVETGPGPMLSSSIHNLELGTDGNFLRMIPSLNGGLYRFNGEYVEIIPFTADDLLRASLRHKEDLVLSGGKESRTYGVDVRTGTVLYECSLHGCENYTADAMEVQEVMLIKRETQTVRAIEPRTSFERWNFSVARHDVKLVPDPAALCHGNKQTQLLPYEIKIIVPDGLVCAVSRADHKTILWKHKFDSPVVSAWVFEKGDMKEVDLFSGVHNHDNAIPISPSLYIGMHKKQLYIQESVQMQQQIHKVSRRENLITDESTYSRIPWKPIPAASNTFGLIAYEDPHAPQTSDEKDQAVKTTGTSVLYASEYVNGHGFFLFSAEQCKRIEDANMLDGDNGTSDDSKETQIIGPSPKPVRPAQNPNNSEDDSEIFGSLWYWWKEVLLISITTAVVMNCMLPQVLKKLMSWRAIPLRKKEELLPFVHDPEKDIPPLKEMQERETMSPEYVSHYLQEFQPVQCLGKGGFGVVFQAKKKFDDAHYAVKRIPLTNKEEARERVLREVKALAKLDHNNIVRYFNSWLECPPPGWQEQQDRELMNENLNSYSSYSHTYPDRLNYSDDCSTKNKNGYLRRKGGRKRRADGKTSEDSCSNRLVVKETDELEESGRFSREEISDSYITFEAPSDNGNESDDEEEDDSNTEQKCVISVGSTTSSHSVKNSISGFGNSRPRHLHKSSNATISYLYIQMQLCRKDSLKDWLRCNPQRDYSTVITFFEQIVMAVEYVHLRQLIHRDLKPSNIFFSMDGHIKIGDFGLVTTMLDGSEEQLTPLDSTSSSSSFGERHTAQVGTELYMSPEQRFGQPYNYKVDIYSLGLILFELLVPFGTEMERIHTMQNLRHQKLPADFQKKHENEFNLLKMMLDHQPDKRPTTIGIRAHPPLRSRQTEDFLADLLEEHYFELPSRQRSSSSFTKLSSSSTSSSEVSPTTAISNPLDKQEKAASSETDS